MRATYQQLQEPDVLPGTNGRRSLFSSLAACLLVLLCHTTAPAQQAADMYSTGIGVRAGNTPGLTVKKFMNERGAVEGILHVFRFRDYDGFLVTGLYEWHYLAFQVPRLYWYVGVGLHAGAYELRDDRDRLTEVERNDNGVLYGADAIVGLEYRFGEVPFTIGADIKPSLTIPTNRASIINGAVNIRWVF